MAAFSVAGKYAIITGAGSGISYTFTRQLLSRGCSVLIGDLSLRPEAQKLLAEYPHDAAAAKAGRPSVLFQKTDVRSWAQLSSLFDKGVSSFPRVDMVVPGAGLFEPEWSSFWNPPKSATNPDTPSRDPAGAGQGIDTYAVIDVNLTHPIRLSQLAVSYWTQNRMPGCLVHVSSVAGHCSSIGSPLYYASKNGLTAFVRSLARLRDDLGIRVGAVAPGAVQTPMLLEDKEKAGKLKEGDVLIPPEEVVDAMFQICENPEYGNGTILEVGKGETRVVPMFNAPPPSAPGIFLPGYVEAEDTLVEKLKKDGLKA